MAGVLGWASRSSGFVGGSSVAMLGGAEPPTGLLFPLRPYTSRVWLCVFDPWSRVEIAEGYCVLAIE